MLTGPSRPTVAIVDYELGNLYSVKHACQHAGLDALITSRAQDIRAADAVILPGVGAFGDAMTTLRRLDLVGVLRDVAASDTPLIGVCLGAQLLLSESDEFGRHEGLGVIDGRVIRFERPMEGERALKVPHIAWAPIAPAPSRTWEGSLLDGVTAGDCMYFVHSYVLCPADPSVVLSRSQYGHVDFCSSMHRGNVFACQFHPERSGPRGLKVYANLAETLNKH